MIRGTTANFKLKLPYEISIIQTATVTFWQENNYGTIEAPLPIVKTLESCNTTDNPYELSITLNPHETARFSAYRKGYMQIVATTIEGVTFGDTPHMFTVYPNKNITPDLPDDPGDIPTDENVVVLDGGDIVG